MNMNTILKSKLLLALLAISVLSYGCKKDDGDDEPTPPQEKQFLNPYYLEGTHIFAATTSDHIGYITVTNPYNEQMKVTVASGAPNIKVTGAGTIYHNDTKTLTVTYVAAPETSVDTKVKVYLNSFGTDDKRDSNEFRVKVVVK